MQIAITGGSGFIGRKLIGALHREGHVVKVLSRNPQITFPAGVRALAGDLTVEDCPLTELVKDCQIVFHCAGEMRDEAKMRLLHVTGTQRLLQAALNESEREGTTIHWIQLSSVGTYGPPSPRANRERVVTENTPSKPCGEYETTKALADELVLRASQHRSVTCTIVRPSIVFGASMPNSSLRALAAMIRRGFFFYIGRSGAIATYVHVDDVVESLVRCAVDPRARGEIFNVSNDCPLEEMIDKMAFALGVRPPSVRLPEFLVRAGVGLTAKFVSIPLTTSRIDALVGRTVYPCLKLKRLLGFAPSLPVPVSIGELLKKGIL